MDLAQAEKTLRKAGFETSVVSEHSNRVREGVVIGSDPPAGTTAPEASVIEIVVSAGPRFDMVRVPDVRGMSVDQARSELEALGLQVKIEESCPGGSTVAETHPTPGTMVRENSVIALFVC
jgi:serine/threonine-protein kinase